MAGSRKGEHRGGAKKKGPHEAKFDIKTGTIKPKRATAKGSRVPIPTAERQREMVEIITGKSELMPKDVQLATMRTIFALAMEYQGLMRMAIARYPMNGTPEQKADVNADVAAAERQMVQYLMLSSQVARDAAPFIHPRLAALAVTTDRNTEGDLFDLLLKEIDQTPRLRAIEHRPVEQNDEEAA